MCAQLTLMGGITPTEGGLDRLAVVCEVEVVLSGIEILASEGAGGAPGVAADLVIEASLAKAADTAVLTITEALPDGGLEHASANARKGEEPNKATQPHRRRAGLRVGVSGAALIARIESLVVSRSWGGENHRPVTKHHCRKKRKLEATHVGGHV